MHLSPPRGIRRSPPIGLDCLSVPHLFIPRHIVPLLSKTPLQLRGRAEALRRLWLSCHLQQPRRLQPSRSFSFPPSHTLWFVCTYNEWGRGGEGAIVSSRVGFSVPLYDWPPNPQSPRLPSLRANAYVRLNIALVPQSEEPFPFCHNVIQVRVHNPVMNFWGWESCGGLKQELQLRKGRIKVAGR